MSYLVIILIQKIQNEEWSAAWWKWLFFCFRIWAYVSSSSVGPCVAGPIDRYDQAQAGGVFSFPWTAEGSRISKCCPRVHSALAFLSSFPLGVCFPGLSPVECTPGIAVFPTAQRNTPFLVVPHYPFLPSFSICWRERPVWEQARFSVPHC